MRNKMMSIIMGILIITNLYTLNSLLECKKKSASPPTPEILSKQRYNDTVPGSLDELIRMLEAQKQIIANLIGNVQQEWTKASSTYQTIQFQLQQLEDQIKELKKTYPEKTED